MKQVDLRENEIKSKGCTALRDALLVNRNITLLELSEQSSDEECATLVKQIKEICAQNKFNSQQDAINQQTTQSTDAADQSYRNSFILNGSDIWNNVSLTSMNGTSSLSSTPRFSLSELFKPIHTLTTTTASITSSLTCTTPPVPPSTPNNQLTPTPSSMNLQHSMKNSSNSLLNAEQQAELNMSANAIEDQVKMHMYSMSLDSPNSYLSSSNNSSQSSDLRQYSSSPGSRFKISQVDNKFLRSNSINEAGGEDANRSAPINTGTTNKMMRSCSLGSWNSKYDKNERTSRSGRFRYLKKMIYNTTISPESGDFHKSLINRSLSTVSHQYLIMKW